MTVPRPVICRRCLAYVEGFARTGGAPDMQISIECRITGYTAIATVEQRKITGWEVLAPPPDRPARPKEKAHAQFTRAPTGDL
jgi:hypothetical protein